jgi:hypothetical protein
MTVTEMVSGSRDRPAHAPGPRAVLAAAVAMALLVLPTSPEAAMNANEHPYVGLWITDDGRVRHELQPGGRYVEARGTREGAYRGRYEVRGSHIDYWDDTGFTADGDFVDADTLHHGGMILRRRTAAETRNQP